jgi:transposase-like protein
VWLGSSGTLTARGLSGVALVTSDAHRGLTEAIGATLGGHHERGVDGADSDTAPPSPSWL